MAFFGRIFSMNTSRLPACAAVFAALAIAASQLSAGQLRLVSPAEGEAVSALTEIQRHFLSLPREERTAWMADPGRRQELRHKPLPTILRWEDQARGSGARRSYCVEVRREPDGLPVFLDTTIGDSVEVRNLEIARTWRWTVRAMEGGRIVDEAAGTFSTEDRAPRVIEAGAVPNMRDIGGRIGLGGRRIRQGLVFRTAGLNSNAKVSPYYPDDSGVMAASAAFDDLGLALERRLESVKALKGAPEKVRPLDFPISPKWTVFYIDRGQFVTNSIDALASLGAEIPEFFLGARGAAIEADKNGCVVLGKPADRVAHAVLMQVVESAEDGWATVGCGADWYWTLRVGGVPVADFTAGNPGVPSADSQPLVVPVRKGANLVVATVCSGSGGWSWHMRPAPAEPIAKIVEKSVHAAETAIGMHQIFKAGLIPGTCRVGDANGHLLRDTLAIRTDIDLRSDRECAGMEGSPLGPGVEWIQVSSAAYAGMQSDTGRASFAKVFRVFLDKSNYPIDFHCIAGRDRTGAVAMIVEALLGVDEDEMRRDWEATVFQDGDLKFRTDRLYEKLVSGFDKWPGETINERVEAYVLSLGFTAADIGFLRGWLLEPVAE